jgi:myo-inositol catabolism protein IolC
MALGYQGKIYILAFDHRGSYGKFLGVSGDPTPEQVDKMVDGKHLIFEGMEKAVEKGVDADAAGVLVDEQYGGTVPEEAKKRGLKLAMPVEKTGQNEFDFDYGEDGFAEHIEKFDPDFVKVLVRSNPDGDQEMNERQTARLKKLSDWVQANNRKFMFELLVPAEPAQLDSVGGDVDRYDAELRPELMRRSIEYFQNKGVAVDIWKIEGVDTREDAEMLAKQARTGEGNEGVTCVLLGRGASNDKVDFWLRQAAPVEGFIGFAIGRSNYQKALEAFSQGDIDRDAATEQIANNYLRFVRVYEEAAKGTAVST